MHERGSRRDTSGIFRDLGRVVVAESTASALDEDTLAALMSPQVEVHRDVKRAVDLVKEDKR